MSLSTSYFDEMYAANPDPWSLASRWYEQRKYAITLASLTRARYRRGFEPGCSVGVLTEQLAARCDSLLATDVVGTALDATRTRTRGQSNVDVQNLAVPRDWPSGEFDLIVISELGYYLADADLTVLIDRAATSLAPDGDLMVVHWRHDVPDYPITGDQVHQAFRLSPRLQQTAAHIEDDFVLDVLSRPGARSVAGRGGLI